ncbi:uncharacterized protein LOC129589579 [Paramacrobiotus metropolitanus]|uniref:uncharacterized protein LOC129589579 n=1 Tax=Paramacrobiotus metropolitanus TaxID=2943436 RepID=UPI002446318B|nr:uncharacterized protein LOC129589579 [Paramacrobiotus metropolitanus]
MDDLVTDVPYAVEDLLNVECTVSELDKIPFSDVPIAITQIIENLLDTLLVNVGQTEMVRMRLDSNCLNRPIWTPPIQRSQLTVKRWMAEVARVLNSYEQFVIDESFEISLQYTDIPKGTCVREVPALLQRRLEKMKSVVLIKNSDQICLARALVIGKAHADGNNNLYRKLMRGKKLQTREAQCLVHRAGFVEQEFNLRHVHKFQEILHKYQIIVVSVDHANLIVFNGPVQEKKIILLHHDRHFDLLNSLPAFFKKKYWCYSCNKGYSDRRDHRCSSICKACLLSSCTSSTAAMVHCEECNRDFFGQECYAQHKKAGTRDKPTRKSICSTVFFCKQCLRIVSLKGRRNGNIHQCGEVFCKTCQKHELPQVHRCYMKPHNVNLEELELNSNAEFLYFDFETYVEGNGILVPNLAVVQDDNGNEWVFPSEEEPLNGDITNQLCTFLFSEDHRDHYIIAHNFKNGIVPKVILNGGKILQLDVPQLNIRFRDSINYNPQSLAKWPATFGLPEISKGTFPHRFNRKENWNCIVPFPSMDEYGYNAMNAKSKDSFQRWYEKERLEKNNLFDFRKEFVDYCKMDVTVLRLCCQQFRKLFQEISQGLCPFVSSLTIAGLCNRYWRSFMLKPEQIALLPHGLNARNRHQSVKAKKWLSWMEEDGNCTIQSAINGSEHRVGPYFVDGYRNDINMVYEFYGCTFHGCPKCVAPKTVHPFRNLPMTDVYQETLDRENYIRTQGYGLTSIWEHEYDEELKTNPEMKAYITRQHFTERLNPRDAFYGGRTNAVKLFHEVSEDEKICYFDVNSEYPFVNKKQTILPPGDLQLPVLPYRCGGKLTFPLCRTCMEKHQNSRCEHADCDRTITGTWCTPEIIKALDKGYTVVRIFEVWHFDKYEDRLFEEYINRFLKLKTEASGWPTEIQSEREKQKYITDFKNHENVDLEYNKINPNPGLRALAKLCLNSFWGRLGMQDNKLNTMYISEPEKFYDMLLSGKYHVHSWDLFNDDVVQITYTTESNFVDRNPNTNVILAAFTTCWARLHLLNFMEMVEGRLLYFDTDSIFFVSRPGFADPPTGMFLGDLTNELKPGQHIVQFVSLGAKTYSYVTNDGDSVVKVKGFTINKRTSEQINFKTMLDMLSNRKIVTVDYPDVLQRNKASMTIRNVNMVKRFQVTYDKRRIFDSEYNTVPYGYILG